MVDVEEPLGEAAKFTASLIFRLWLDWLEKVVGSGDTLAIGSEVDPPGAVLDGSGSWGME